MARTQGLEKALARAEGDLERNDKQLEGGWFSQPNVQKEDKLLAERAHLAARKEEIESHIARDNPLLKPAYREEKML